MSHTKSRVPKYGLHKPTGQARVVFDGSTYYLGRYGTEESHAKYQQLIAFWIANHRTVPSRQATTHDLTVCELLLAYLRFAEGYYVKNGKVTSEYSCLKLAVRPLEELYGQTIIAEFGPRQLKAVRERMIAANLSRNVINKHMGRIKRVFKWGVENEVVPGSVSHALSAISGLRKGRSSARETEPVKPVSDEHVDAIQPFVSPQIWGIIQLQRLGGFGWRGPRDLNRRQCCSFLPLPGSPLFSHRFVIQPSAGWHSQDSTAVYSACRDQRVTSPGGIGMPAVVFSGGACWSRWRLLPWTRQLC